MHPALSQNVYIVKEHVGMWKAANNYDIHDPDTGAVVMECREDNLGTMTKIARSSWRSAAAGCRRSWRRWA